MRKMSFSKVDLSAGFSVALVALPLSIGIALASGAPASAGLIAAIVGGLVGSWLGGCQVTINGPAAGLIVIVLDAILELGHGDNLAGFRGMLAASVVAGFLQILFGALKLGRKGTAFPVSVIHGMMAAIGLIILAKQTHLLLGHVPHAKNPIMLFAELPEAVLDIKPLNFLVGVFSLLILVLWPRIDNPVTKRLPAPLVAVVIGSGLAAFLGFEEKALLSIPADLGSWVITPDFSVMSTFAGWKASLSLAMVASLETVLSAAAVDKIDPQRRSSDLDRDLFSKGVCNMLSASVGGLPMIAEIVRSSANVTYGARTWLSNFTHGAVILSAVILFPTTLTRIPLAALAAILVLVGSRLGSPKHFLHAKKVGLDNLSGFVVTLVMTLAVDLLVGIFAGAVVQFLVELWLGLKLKDITSAEYETSVANKTTVFSVKSALTFSNFLGIKEKIASLRRDGTDVKIELLECEYIDHSVMDQIEELKHDFERNHLHLDVELSEKHRALGSDPLSAKKKIS